MTVHADGTVYINSKLDTSGFKPGSKEIEAACRRAANSVKGMGDAAKIALEKQINAFVKQNQMYAQQEQKVKEIEKTLEEMSKQKVETETFKNLSKELDSAEKQLDKFYGDLRRIESTKGLISPTTIKNTEKDIDALREKIRQLKIEERNATGGKAGIIGKEIGEYERQLNDLIQKLADMKSKNEQIKNSYPYKKASEQIGIYSQKVDELRGKIEELKASGGDYQPIDTSAITNKLIAETERLSQMNSSLGVSYDALKYKIEQYGGTISGLANRHGILRNTFSSVYDAVKKGASVVGDATKKALKKLDSLVNRFAKRIISAFSKIGKSAMAADKGFSGVSLSLKNILKYGFGIRSLFVLVNRLRAAIKEGFENLSTYSKGLADSVNGVKATALTLKNAFAAAFSPIVEIAIPYVQKLLDYMVQLVNIAGQFFAALTGRKTYTKAIKQTTEALKEETAEMNKQLSPLDKLNNLSSQQGGKDAGVGGAMFEEVPIESGILDAAEKIKDILSKLFEPLKKAWEQEGQFVMDSWKYALEEVWKLIKDIERDFMIVWNEDETVAVLANILHIIGDIGLIVGNLARNFREAWNTNQVGLEILRNIRDVIGIIVQHIRNMADATVEWADKLNFYPILDAFERFLDSIKPVTDAIWGILEDFYTKVILPLSKWTVEKGLPELLQVFIDFNNKVDWKSLRKNIAELWEHLEPFAETVGEGLILFIRKVSDALADFLNSQEFKDFLKAVEDWMDSVTPEDVANALEKIAKGLIMLKLALLGFSAIKGIAGIFTAIKSFLAFFGVGGGATAAAGGAGILAGALHGLVVALAAVAAAVVGWEIGKWINEKLLGVDTPSFHEMMEGIKSSFKDGSWKEALKLWGDDIYDAFVLLGERQDEVITGMREKLQEFGEYIRGDWNNSYIGQMIASFTDGSWEEALQLWGEDIKADVKSVGEFIKDDWNNSYIGQMISSFTDGSWMEALKLWKDDILDAFDTLGDRMSEKWNDIWESIKSLAGDAFDWIAKKWSSISNSLGSFGSKVGGMFKNYSISIPNIQTPVVSVPTIPTANIPYLATGAVIPPNAPFAAILGDQKNGNNLEMPENLLRKIVREESGGMGNGDITVHITAECEGYQLFNIMQKLDRQFFKQNGRHAFA